MKLSNLYAQLPSVFFQKARAHLFHKPELLFLNDELEKELQLNLPNNKNDCALYLSGAFENDQHIAMVYAGHQFGHFNPQLGDGRALLLGEKEVNKKTYEVHLKGSGPTPYSRGGDGFCPLGPALREYLMSEAMFKLGVPTTRTLSVVKTNRPVQRETLLDGAVITRIADSHIRFGSFEYFANKNDLESLRTLADFAIQRHDPDLQNSQDKYNIFFKRICDRTLALVAKWMSLGFIHGVMNTDNMTVSGQTIDYGPCAFMNEFNKNQVYSFIDRQGRYAYDNQGHIAIWNLSCLANALFPIIKLKDENEQDTIKRLSDYFLSLKDSFQLLHTQSFSKKLGIFNYKIEDSKLITDFLNNMQDNKLDFTNTFRSLNTFKFNDKNIEGRWLRRIEDQTETKEECLKLMSSVNPSIIPRNAMIEDSLEQAYSGNFDLYKSLYLEIKRPYLENQTSLLFTAPVGADIRNTFCGT